MLSRFLLRFLPLLALTVPIGSQGRKLNAPLAREAIPQFYALHVSPSGDHLIYWTDRDGNHTFELYSQSLRGEAAPVEFVTNRATDPSLTSDSKNLLFSTDLDADGTDDLALAAINGSAATRALAAGVGAEHVERIEPCADGEHVLYLRSRFVRYQYNDIPIFQKQLYSVTLAEGSVPFRLSGALVDEGSVEDIALSKDGRTVLYRADQETDEVFELFVAPVDGSTPARRLALPLVPGGDVVNFRFDADGCHALYTADQDEDERFELFSIAIEGGAPPRRLNGPLVSGGDVGHDGYFQLSPDSRWIVYFADQEVNGRLDLFSVPVDGSRAPVSLSAPSDRPVSASISYDSAWVVYLSDPSRANTFEVLSVPIDGSAPARGLGASAVPSDFDFSPAITFDSRFAVYRTDQDGDEVHELYGAPLDGGAPPVQLNGTLQLADTRYLRFGIMDTGIMFPARLERDGPIGLYFAPFPLGSPARLLAPGPIETAFPLVSYLTNPPTDTGAAAFQSLGVLQSVRIESGGRPLPLDTVLREEVVGDVESFDLDPAGERVLYVAREEDDRAKALYSVSTGERRDAVQLHPEGSSLGDTRSSPDGRWVVFESAVSTDGPRLYSAPANGSGGPALLHPADAGSFVFTPDGQRLVFRALESSRMHLFAAPLDGSEPAALLSAALPPGAYVLESARCSANGRWVAMRSSAFRLYVSAVDGALPAEEISAANHLVAGSYELSADGSRVFFLTDPAGSLKGELFVAPGNGSGEPLRLSAELGPRDDVRAMAVTPDGARVLYLMDPEGAVGAELYSVLADGSAPPVRLHAPLPERGKVESFQVARNGNRVVYRASIVANRPFELFSAPVDASRPPVRVGWSPLADGDVLSFQVSPDSRRVVYRAEAVSTNPNDFPAGAIHLFSAPIQGSRTQRRIGEAPFNGGDVHSFQISADGSTVAFAAERDARRQLTLLAVPIGGEKGAIELVAFQGSGGVRDYRISADGSLVAFRADLEVPDAIELYAARTSSPTATAARLSGPDANPTCPEARR